MPNFTRGRGKGRGGSWSQWKKRGSFGRGSTTDTSASHITDFQPSISCNNEQTQYDSQYKGWQFYYSEEEFACDSTLVGKVKLFEEFFLKNKQYYSSIEIEDNQAFCIDLNNLCSDEDIMAQWPFFLKELTDYPDRTLSGMSLAMHQIIRNELQEQAEGNPVNIPSVRARPINFEPIIQLKNLKANYHGKLVSLKGTVIRVGSIKLLCTSLGFACNSCGYVQGVRQTDGIHKQPIHCIGLNCRARSFSPLCTSTFTQTQNWQIVRLQEHVADDQREGGRVPRTVECELVDDLIDTCGAGDVVTITGIVKVRNTEDNKKNGPSMFLMYIYAVSVVNSKTHSLGGRNSGNMTIEFSLKDYYAIKEIHSEPLVFRLLVNSLCPAVYGHEMVKAGLLLALFGGATGVSRGDIHILMVGDPGLGKSHMLQSCSTVAPRGVYVCGNTSTASGLTVTLTREGGGDYALEAGALVLANQGCCCIDEFDKMSTQHEALLEAMEQQCISIAKAGVVCSLPARTSILAAANPSGGHYNNAKTVSENLRMGQALLSRFDLVFILLDKPNEHLDSLLSEHIMALHSNLKETSQSSISNCVKDKSSKDPEVPLSERLKLKPGEYLDAVPQILLRKYIAYARKYVPSPILSAGAARILQHFYLELRKQHHSKDSTPVTTRQLESLIRLTQARAKLELREEATEYDALDVVELLRWSMVETLSNELGILDFQRSQNGSGMSSTSQAKKFINGLQQRAQLQCKSVFSGTELKELAASLQLNIPDFHSFVSALNLQGFLIMKGNQLYQLLTVDY